MTRARGSARLVVKRGGRLYLICGGAPPIVHRRGLVVLPGAALLLALVFSIFAFVHPLEAPGSVQHRLPLAQVAHYTAEDFFSAAR